MNFVVLMVYIYFSGVVISLVWNFFCWHSISRKAERKHFYSDSIYILCVNFKSLFNKRKICIFGQFICWRIFLKLYGVFNSIAVSLISHLLDIDFPRGWQTPVWKLLRMHCILKLLSIFPPLPHKGKVNT